MHKKSASDKASCSTASLISRKSSTRLSEVGFKSEQASVSNAVVEGRKVSSALRSTKDHTLTSIIEEKVSNLKTKFDELSGLRKKFVDHNTGSEPSPILTQAMKNRNKLVGHGHAKNKGILDGVIFQTEDCRGKNKGYKDQDLHDRVLGNTERFSYGGMGKGYERTESIEIESLRFKLRSKEKELQELEKVKILQEETINKKEVEIKGWEEKYKVLVEINKSLKMQMNRLETKMKSLDDKKSTNVNAIKNLSYIILSKDSPGKEMKENKDQGFMLKYIETLNELQGSDQLTLTVFDKLKNNQNREAFRILMNIEEEVASRLERTKDYVEQLENVVYECKSPGLSKPDPLPSKDLNQSDFYCFMKAQASLIEEILIVT